MFNFHLCSCCKFVLRLFFIPAIALGFFLFIYDLVNSKDGEIAVVVSTLIVAVIAWFQLKGLQKTARGDFLMRIDHGFRDKRIQNAFKKIYTLDRKSSMKCAEHQAREPHCLSCEDAVSEDMKLKLTGIWYSNRDEDIEMRFDISSYLDYLEMLAYFVNAEYILLDDIDNIHGGIIRYHCVILGDWISNVRKNEHDAYSQLVELCSKLSD